MRTIALEGLRFHARVGVHEEEKIRGNEIQVDVYLVLSSGEMMKDKLSETLDYEKVYREIVAVMSMRMNLLETACREILNRVVPLSSQIEKIRVRVSKVHPPIPGQIDRAYVEEEWARDREG